MLKKIALALLVLLLILVQGLFIYALEHGAKEQYLSIWSSFGVSVPAYTHFVFRTAAWWWAGSVAGIALLAIALYRNSRPAAVGACLLSAALVVALLWSAYAPSLLVRI